MELPEGFYDERLVIKSVLNPDTLTTGNVSKNQKSVGWVEFLYINNANITVSDDGMTDTAAFSFSDPGWHESENLVVQSEISDICFFPKGYISYLGRYRLMTPCVGLFE